jgi:hypothetical protein
MAMTACEAKFCTSASCFSVKERTSRRFKTSSPTSASSFSSGTARRFARLRCLLLPRLGQLAGKPCDLCFLVGSGRIATARRLRLLAALCCYRLAASRCNWSAAYSGGLSHRLHLWLGARHRSWSREHRPWAPTRRCRVLAGRVKLSGVSLAAIMFGVRLPCHCAAATAFTAAQALHAGRESASRG